MCVIYKHRKCLAKESEETPGFFILTAKRKIFIIKGEELPQTFISK